jgi:hypothetical protein
MKKQKGHEGENQNKHRGLRKQARRTSEDKKKQGRVSGQQVTLFPPSCS